MEDWPWGYDEEEVEAMEEAATDMVSASSAVEQELLMAKSSLRNGDAKGCLARIEHALWQLRNARAELDRVVS